MMHKNFVNLLVVVCLLKLNKRVAGGKRGRMYPWGNKLMPRVNIDVIYGMEIFQKKIRKMMVMYSALTDAFGLK